MIGIVIPIAECTATGMMKSILIDPLAGHRFELEDLGHDLS